VTERRIAEILRILEGDPYDGLITVAYTNDLTDSEREELKGEIEDLRRSLADLCSHFQLEPTSKTARSEVSIAAAYLWEDLAGAVDSKMTGYGYLNPDLEEDIKVRLKKMIDQVNTIRTSAAL
jgi:hypothetical protein